MGNGLFAKRDAIHGSIESDAVMQQIDENRVWRLTLARADATVALTKTVSTTTQVYKGKNRDKTRTF